MKYIKKGENRKRHWKQNAGRQHDGFRVVGTEGGYMFIEGRKPPPEILTEKEAHAIALCAKRRGIGKGFFVITAPQENGCKYGAPELTRYKHMTP